MEAKLHQVSCDLKGLVVFHVAGNVGFKKTLERDDEYKGSRN